MLSMILKYQMLDPKTAYWRRLLDMLEIFGIRWNTPCEDWDGATAVEGTRRHNPNVRCTDLKHLGICLEAFRTVQNLRINFWDSSANSAQVRIRAPTAPMVPQRSSVADLNETHTPCNWKLNQTIFVYHWRSR